MKNTRIVGNQAVDTTTGDVTELFHPDIASQFVVCPDAVEDGWIITNGIWSAPVPALPITPDPAPAPAQRALSKLDYMNRFHDAELAAIYTTAKTVIQVEIWLEKFKLAAEIDLDDPRTVAGVQALEAAGLIGEGRAAEILG